MISLPFLLFFLPAVVFGLVRIVSKNFDFFEKRRLKFRKPYPFLGTNTWLPLRGTFADYIQESYNSFSKEKLFGLFDFQTPIFVIKDPTLIKRLTIKDFDYFTDHKRVTRATNALINSTIFFMEGRRWREMRASLSPAFTGSKMRLMFDLINNCCQQMVKKIDDEYEKFGPQPHDIKDLFTKYTNDVIATCAFGIKCDSFQEPNNSVYQIGRQFLNIRKPTAMLKMLMIRFFPLISKYLNIAVLDPKMKEFFQEVIIDTMKTREENNIVRPDMIHLLMQLKKGELKAHDDEGSSVESKETAKKDWSDIELIGQCFIFFLAGFQTSSTLMVFTAYELAMNREIQEKLRQEIEEVKAKLNGKPVTYEAIQGLKYMDLVISEVLRKWPPVLRTDRICVKNYKYEDEDGVKFEMNAGDTIWVPIYALHRDPEYFPDPDKFDPERFNEENKHSINPNTYLPFGVGPRICIGSRFAMLETKMVLYYLLGNFSFEICAETAIPLKLRKGIVSVTPEKNVILNLKPLNK